MAHSDRELMSALREVIRTEIREVIRTEVNERIDQIVEAQKSENEFKIEDYESDINKMIRDFIHYNLAITVDC